eukprot:scaffold603_cov404-Prasinococcus_capsulatus_cf.AAC.46
MHAASPARPPRLGQGCTRFCRECKSTFLLRTMASSSRSSYVSTRQPSSPSPRAMERNPTFAPTSMNMP